MTTATAIPSIPDSAIPGYDCEHQQPAQEIIPAPAIPIAIPIADVIESPGVTSAMAGKKAAHAIQLIPLLKRGIDEPAKLGRILGITADEVREEIEVLRTNSALPILTPGQRERAKIKLAVAEAIKSGADIAATAAKFNKSTAFVRAACRLHGIEVPEAEQGTGGQKTRVYSIIAALIEIAADEILAKADGRDVDGRTGRRLGVKSLITLGKEIGVSHEWISKVRERAEKAGIFAAVEKVRRAAVASGKG